MLTGSPGAPGRPCHLVVEVGEASPRPWQVVLSQNAAFSKQSSYKVLFRTLQGVGFLHFLALDLSRLVTTEAGYGRQLLPRPGAQGHAGRKPESPERSSPWPCPPGTVSCWGSEVFSPSGGPSAGACASSSDLSPQHPPQRGDSWPVNDWSPWKPL